MKRHFKDNWIIYFYLLIQIPQIWLKYKNIIHWRWIYVMMPTLIMVSLIVLVLFLGLYCGIRDEYTWDRNGNQ